MRRWIPYCLRVETPLALFFIALPVQSRDIKVFPGLVHDAMVDSIKQLGHGDTLTFTKGEYPLPGPLYFRSYTTVRGEMRDSVKLSLLRRHKDFYGPYDPQKPRYCWNESYRHWEIQKGAFVESLLGGCMGPAFLESVTVQDLRVEGYPDDADIDKRPEHPFDLMKLGGNYITVRNCEFRHSRNGGVLLFGGRENVIAHCIVENTALDGIFASGLSGIVIRDNKLSANRDNSIAFDCMNVARGKKENGLNYVDCGENSVILRNVIDNGRANPLFRFHPDGRVVGYNYYGWKNSGTDKDPRAYASGGIYVGRPGTEKDANGFHAKVKGLTIEGNVVKGSWLYGIRLAHGCENITIRDNLISAPECRLYGIGLDADDGALDPKSVRLIGNSVLTPTPRAFYLKRGRDIVFSGNLVSLQPRKGLRLSVLAKAGDMACEEHPESRTRTKGRKVEIVCH